MSSLFEVRSQRLTFLDSIRGLAALSVVWSHFALGYGALVPFQTVLEHTPLHLFWDGSAAVSMFFVLSGFVLSLKYLQPPDFKVPIQLRLSSFYISRICRISLPFMAMLGISYAGCHWLYHHHAIEPSMTKWLRDFWTSGSLAAASSFPKQALLFLPNTTHFYVPQGWTLTLELQASLCMPFLILVAHRNQIFLMIICILSIGYDLFLNNNFTVSMYILLYFHFYLGILLSCYLPAISRWGYEQGLLAKGLLFCLALFFYTFRHTLYVRYPEMMKEISVWYFTAMGAFLFLVLVLGSTKARNLLDYAPCRYLGKVSYSLYLCHLLVLLIPVPLALSFLNHWGLPAGVAHYAAFFLTTLFALGFSVIFYGSIEKPAMNLGHWLAKVLAASGLF
ncbi:MAG: acyltransferase [Desulfobulbaceae bacterium]|nr:acyltransferase [Desulfobulbaceae bacterium]